MNYNPTFPDQLGLEMLLTRNQTTRVSAGSPGRMLSLPSTTSEEISDLRLSTWVNPQVRASVPTLIDVIEEGNEMLDLPTLVRLKPTSDKFVESWHGNDDGTTDLFSYIDGPTFRWPNPQSTAQSEWIRTYNDRRVAVFGTEGSSLFGSGGAAENGRIAWVGVGAILGANTGFRKMGVNLLIEDEIYAPAAGSTRDVHGFGSVFEFWWGEINPHTQRPWTPADIAKFDTEANWGIRIRSGLEASISRHPQVRAIALHVQYWNDENREAVGVWRRPENMTARLNNITTDQLVKPSSGDPNWNKKADTNYRYFWRQSISPSEYGPTVADDVRWNGGYQDLGPAGQPPNIVYPLQTTGTPPAPTDSLSSQTFNYDPFGRAVSNIHDSYIGDHRSTYAIAMIRQSDANFSVDSQPYRVDLSDLVRINASSSRMAQKMTPPSTQTYVGFRMPVWPSQAPTGMQELKVSVHVESSGTQVGGDSITDVVSVRRMPHRERLRYLTGFFSEPATLNADTQYEVRLNILGGSTAGGTKDWIVVFPSCSLAPSASFGGTDDCAIINGLERQARDLCLTLIKQPDAPEDCIASIDVVNVPKPDGTFAPVEHIKLDWVPGDVLGADFRRYEIERELETDPDEWARVAFINDEDINTWTDHTAPRVTETTYRIRSVALDGRISGWAVFSPTLSPAPIGNCPVLLTSNHATHLETVLDIDRDVSYDFFSTDNDEILQIYGTDYQVVFMENEDRGIGWSFGVKIGFGNQPPPGATGPNMFEQILAITRSQDIPYVVVMDPQGTRILGHVTPSDANQQQPGNVYNATLTVIPTHSDDIHVEIDE